MANRWSAVAAMCSGRTRVRAARQQRAEASERDPCGSRKAHHPPDLGPGFFLETEAMSETLRPGPRYRVRGYRPTALNNERGDRLLNHSHTGGGRVIQGTDLAIRPRQSFSISSCSMPLHFIEHSPQVLVEIP